MVYNFNIFKLGWRDVSALRVCTDQSSVAPTSGDPQPTCNSSSRGSSALSWSLRTPALMCTYLHTHLKKKINVFENYQKSDSVSLFEALSHHCPSQTSGAGAKDSLGGLWNACLACPMSWVHPQHSRKQAQSQCRVLAVLWKHAHAPI